MNLMLFEEALEQTLLPAQDARAVHVRKVLRMQAGDSFDVGAVNGPRGKARIVTDDEWGMRLRFRWGHTPPPPLPIALVVGLSRPQTMRKILREASPLGISELHFVRCEKSEPGYATSSLWTSDEWRTQLMQGAEQAFTTWLPQVVHHESLAAALGEHSAVRQRLALDNYEATLPMAGWSPGAPSATALKEGHVLAALAVGPERGWSPSERASFRDNGWSLVHLGPRVLRTETAVISGSTLMAAALGGLDALDLPGTG